MQSRWLVFFLVLLVSAVQVQAVINEHSTKIFAVTNDGKGLAADLDLRITPGKGQIYSGIDSLIGTSTQNAYKTAVELAKNYVSTSNQYDYYFTIKSSASIVDGPSAGAATALLIVSMLQDKKIPEAVAMTGTISNNGQVGTVGGVFEKTRSASEAGIKLFMIPKGEARQITRTGQGIQSVNLIEYAPKEWGLKVVEVETLDQALQFAFSDIGSIDINKQIEESKSVFVPEPIPYDPQVAPLHGITEKYLQRAQEQLKQAKAELNTTILNDTQLVDVMFESLTESEKVLEQSQTLYDQNFLYSSANFAFTAMVNAMLVRDIAQNPSILNENSTVFQSKLQKLKKDLDAVKERLDGPILTDRLDWQIAAQQRWLWSYNNLNKLQNTQTIVIQTGEGGNGVNPSQLDRLRDYEFAVAWKDAADDFSQELQSARQQSTSIQVFQDFAEEEVINAENKLPLVQTDERVDIQRRFDGAKTAESMKWFLSAAADATSVTALVNAEEQSKGKDLATLEALLNQKIADLDQKLKEDKPYVWSRIYLDHARYFQQAVKYYQQQNRTSQALDAAQSGVSVVFLAQGAFDSQQKIYSLASSIPSTPFKPQPFKPVGNSQNPYFWTLALAAMVFFAAFVVLIVAYLQKKKELSGEKELPVQTVAAKQLLRDSLELDRKFMQGKMNQEAYLKKRKEISSAIAKLPASDATPEKEKMARLGTQMSELEKQLQELRQSLKNGSVSHSEFSKRVESIQKQLKETQEQLEAHKKQLSLSNLPVEQKTSSLVETKSKRSGTAIEDIASEIRKSKSTKSKGKTKK